MRNVTFFVLLALLIACGVTAQAAVVFTEDFSSDPFASPARWAPSGAVAPWSGSDMPIYNGGVETTSANDVELNPKSGLAAWTFDFQINEDQGPWAGTKAFRNPGVDQGYQITCYYSGGWAPWFADARLSVIGGSENHTPLVVGQWYTMKTELSDDGSRSIVTVTVTVKSSGVSAGYVQYADASATRLKVHKGILINGYSGNGGVQLLNIDNASVSTGSAAVPSFSPDGGTFVSAPGETAIPATISCATSGASISYTTDGSDPTATNGTVVASGSSVNVPDGATLKAVAWTDSAAPSAIKSATFALQTAWCEDFSTDPLASPARWEVFGNPAHWDGAAQTMVGGYGRVSSTNAAILNTNYAASYEFDFKYRSNLGPQMRFYAFSSPGVDGYEFLPYPDGNWYNDGRLTRVGGSSTHQVYTTTDIWYHVKVDLLNDAAFGTNGRSLVTARITRKSDGAQVGYIQSADDSTTRLKVQKGVAVLIYGGDNGLGTDFDNVCVTATAGPPAAQPTFSPDGGTFISASGETTVPVTITSATAGASIRYTTDGTNPTTTNGTLVASGSTVNAPAGTLKAIAVATGYAPSAIRSGTFALQAGFFEDFSTDPSARWATTGAAWNSTDQVEVGNYAKIWTTTDYVLNTRWPAFYQWDFKFYSNLGVGMRGYAFSNLAIGETGYEVQPYSGINCWFWDGRLTQIGGSNTCGQWTIGAWYSMKMEMFDDVANNRSVVTATTFRSDGSVKDYIQLADTSASRLRVHKGVSIFTYPGDNWLGGPDIDNVRMTGSVAEPAAMPAFSPEGGTQICAEGETSVPVTIYSSTSGASIRYTTDGSDPTPTTGTEVANGSIVSVSDGATLKAIAVAAGFAISAVKSGTYVLQAGFCDDFSTDPFAGGRWTTDGNGMSWSALATWNSTDQVVTGNYAWLRTANDFVVNTKSGASYHWDFKFYGTTMGPQMEGYAFSNSRAGEDGYRVGPYSAYNGTAGWYDSRLTRIGGSDSFAGYSPDVWYTMKLDMLDDTANNRSVVTATVTRKSDGGQMAYIQLADTSSSRLKVHRGINLHSYRGDDWLGGPDIDNVCLSSSLAEKAMGDAKRLADGAAVGISDKVVTALFAGGFYVEESDRSSGIRVASAAVVAVGDVVRVTGVLGTTSDYERYINASVVSVTGTGSVEPLMLINRSVGGVDYFYNAGTGAGQKGVADGIGLNNIGLLVATTGKVTYVGSTYFYIDDGLEARDFSIFSGIRVICPAGTAKPTAGQSVTINGISSILKVQNTVFRCIRIRNVSDIQISQ